jgi:hypothetical protein
MNVLGVMPAVNTWTDYVGGVWKRKVKREEPYLAWTIDGVPLPHCLPFEGGGANDPGRPWLTFVTPLTHDETMFAVERESIDYLDRLAGRSGPDFRNGRTGVLICDCGDWGCGSLSAFVSRTDEHVEWRDVQWYAYFDPEEGEPTAPTGPTFAFDAQQYDQVLADLTAEFAPPTAQ